ncbi:MAG TPA: heparin lyase I family protein [Polyangia bacterium]|nr:heparin lyase I family protein [Polyangia bacterium]
MQSNPVFRLWPFAVFVVAGGFSVVSRPAQATVVWTSTFEKGDLSEWMPGTNPTKGARKNVEVLGEKVHGGSYACKITVHPDDLFGGNNQDRVDIQHQSTLTAEGKDTWISGYYLMPADAGMRNEFAFWESNGSSQNVMDFWIEPKGMTGGGTTIGFGVGALASTKLWTADFTVGVWHQVAIHVHWSTSATMGSVDAWFDGQQVVTNHQGKTKADTNTLFYQNGLHRRSPGNFTDIIYFDDLIEADTFAEAKIMASGQPDTDGGASADGAADSAGTSGSGGSATSGSGGSVGGAGSGGASGSGGATLPTGSGGAPAPGTGGSGTTGGGVSAGSGCTLAAGDQSGAGLSALLMLVAIAWVRVGVSRNSRRQEGIAARHGGDQRRNVLGGGREPRLHRCQ